MESPSTKPIIMLLHGIWHSPLTYTKFVSALQRCGYEVHVPWLPSCTGARPPKADFSADVQLVRRFTEMLVDQGRDVLMIMHSYGGIVGCSALDGLAKSVRSAQGRPGGVSALIGLAAHIYPQGFSIIDMVSEMGNKDLIPVAFHLSEDGSCFSGDARGMLGFPDDQADELIKTLSRANFSTMEAKVQGEAWNDIPLTYVCTTKDVTLPPTYQDRILEKIGVNSRDLRVEKLHSGHSPFVTHIDELVRIVEDVSSPGLAVAT